MFGSAVAIVLSLVSGYRLRAQVRVNDKVLEKAAFVAQGRKCATEEPNALQRRRAMVARDLFRRGANAEALKTAQIVVPVVFHVIHDKQNGKLERGPLDEQIKVL